MYVSTIVTLLCLIGSLASEARGDFTLWNNEQLTVNTPHALGTLYDQSHAWLAYGGNMNRLEVYNTSTVDISGGWGSSQTEGLYAYHTSTVNVSEWSGGPGGGVWNYYAYDSNEAHISGGEVLKFNAYDSSTVDISGGEVDILYAYDSSTVEVSGGIVGGVVAYDTTDVEISGGESDYLYAHGTADISGGSVDRLDVYSTSSVNLSGGEMDDLYARGDVTFTGREFHLGAGLSLDGDQVLGTGFLSGEWYDGTNWTVNIARNDSGAVILLVPEPATLSLLALGGLAMLRRRRK